MSDKKKTQILVRMAAEVDLEECLRLNHSLETQVVWQMKVEEVTERTQITFQTLRLPRAIRVEYPRNNQQLRQEFAGANAVLVAEAEGLVLGYIHVMLTPADQSAWVRNLVVDEPYRKRRIGRALVEQACAWAKREGAKHITFEATARSYPAIRFLTAQGLLFCGFNDRYYPSQDIAVFFGRNL